jgi:hypothetical protein
MVLRVVFWCIEAFLAPALGRARLPCLKALAVALTTPRLLALAWYRVDQVLLGLVSEKRISLLVALFVSAIAAVALCATLDSSLEAFAVFLEALTLRALADSSLRVHTLQRRLLDLLHKLLDT